MRYILTLAAVVLGLYLSAMIAADPVPAGNVRPVSCQSS